MDGVEFTRFQVSNVMIGPLLFVAGAGAVGWFSIRYAWWRPCVSRQNPRILMYHMIRSHRPGTRFNKLRVPPHEFAKQVAWLKRHDFTFVFASQLFSGEGLPEKTVCITFDDGYEDNIKAADPVLAEHGAVATLYLVVDRDAGWSSKKKAHHGDDELQSEPKLSDAQVRTLISSGRWELGGHTRTHANLLALNEDAARDEIKTSRDELQREFGVFPQTFAYPFGLYDAQHPSMLREVGFVGAVTTDSDIAPQPYADPMSVPRIKVSGNDNMLGFIMRMKGGKRGLFK